MIGMGILAECFLLEKKILNLEKLVDVTYKFYVGRNKKS